MVHFNPLPQETNIQKLIKETFDANLPLSGDWGYSKERATIIDSLPQNMPLSQLQHTLTTIRTHLEMNIMQDPENRYGAINANEKAREQNKSDTGIFDKVTYEITAIKEDLYNTFIKEYKEGYGKDKFDLNVHFQRRKEATLTRKITYYFEVSHIQ